ncbi:protein of unknown function (plasmid) [Shinella sp. WSC3-e]|nr:hypothetical protein SHINE37_100269 [Rhizobiaceae bacterium]CAK7261821.1 protein of unknown function [Shinella sp. WSC3-e]
MGIPLFNPEGLAAFTKYARGKSTYVTEAKDMITSVSDWQAFYYNGLRNREIASGDASSSHCTGRRSTCPTRRGCTPQPRRRWFCRAGTFL